MADVRSAVEQWFKVMDGTHDAKKAAALCDANCEFVAPGANLKGPEQIAGFLEVFFTAFPDITHNVTTLVTDGNVAMVELNAIGTHTGPFMTPQGAVPPTNKPIRIDSASRYEITGDKLTSLRVYFDPMALMGQIGAL